MVTNFLYLLLRINTMATNTTDYLAVGHNNESNNNNNNKSDDRKDDGVARGLVDESTDVERSEIGGDSTTEDGWVTDVTNENGVLVASRIIIEGHFNASKEGIEDETVVDEVDVEGIEHGWVVVDYDLVEEDGEYGCWVAYYDIIEGGHFNASEEGIEGETVVDEVDVEGIEHWVVIDYDLVEEEGTEDV
jgi:hypothetical protein